MTKICVAYLFRARDGLEAAESFFQSYRDFGSGFDHDLLIIVKGFKTDKQLDRVLSMASDLKPQVLRMSDRGFDLRGYRLAARRYQNYSHFCFFNSFSEILAHDWLAKMYSQLSKPGIGLVGATGSWESMYSNVQILRATDPNPPLLRRLWSPIRLRLCQFSFFPFPNYHIRTNAFIISRELLWKVWPRFIITKRGAYLFENGKNSLTNRIARLGLRCLVVGRDGEAYAREVWDASRTYRQGGQENLLVADNQTRRYESGTESARKFLSAVAWGTQRETARDHP